MRRLALIFAPLVLFVFPAHAVDYIYWTDSGAQHVRRADLSVLTPVNIATSTDGLQQPYGVAVDGAGSKVYWSDAGTAQKLQRRNLDGSGSVEDIQTGLTTPRGVALDSANGKVYWTDEGTRTIRRSNLDGTSPQTLVTLTGLAAPVGIALDVAGGKMYWTDNFNGFVQRANLDGSTIETLVTGLSSPKGIDLDLTNNRIYWATGNVPTSEIRRADLNGSNNTQVISSSTETIQDIALNMSAGQIYWIGGTAIRRANLAAPIPQTVISGLNTPRGLALALNLPANILTVTSAADSGAGTLRDRLTNAASGDTILFDPTVFPPGAPVTITLTSTLPSITQGGITLDASNAGVRVNGNNLYQCFNFASSNNAIKGLRVQGCTSAAITLAVGTSNNTIGGNNGVGSGPSGEGNIIVNNSSGVLINTSNSNTVTGNYIGTDPSSNTGLGNTGVGINISTGQNNTIGGTSAGLRNVISSNASYGVSIQNASATLNRIIGNYIGTNVAGTAPMANSFGVGVVTSTTANTIGGTAAGERNVISGNTNIGVNISGASNNVVVGNFIGVGSDGVTQIPNGTGLAISALGSGNTIGGTAANAGNVISGNTNDGISITASSNSVLQGNYIGTNASATAAVPNGGRGITINTSSSGNTIGGTVANSANVIAGNTLQGIRSTATGTNTIVGNFIGTNSAMTTIPNGGAIAVTSGTINIGNASEVQANVLSSSGGGTALSITGGTVNFAGTIDLDGHLTTTAGTLNMGSAAVYFSGGSWNNNSVMTVNPGTSTFTLDGTVTQSITTGSLASWNNFVITNSGTITFQDGFTVANLTATTPSTWINFSGGATYTISGTLTLNGQATGTRIILRSTSASRFILNLTGGVQYAYYVNVQDSEVTGNNLYATGWTNGANTDAAEAAPHWIFGTARVVTSTLDSGAGTLREALSLAVAGDVISFNAATFPIGSGTTITLASTLSVTQGDITLDATSADVVLSGGGTLATGLTISSSNNVVRGLRIQNFTTNGIYITSGTNNIIGGDRTSGSGPNGQGNTIVSNGIGIRIDSSLNYVYGNYIGTDGTADLGNNQGIALYGSANTIGGSGTGLRNVISGNNGNGISVFSTSSANTIQANYIGTDATGSSPIPNSVHGIELSNSAGSNIIGGTGAGEGNVLSGNTWSGILLDDSNNNSIAGNIIGANATATAPLPNGASGIEVSTTSTGITIGGTGAGAGNVIAGNGTDGIRHTGSGTISVYGNFIGTNSSGASLPNASDGIELLSIGTINLGNAAEVQPNVIGPNTALGLNLNNGVINLAGTIDVNDDVTLTLGTFNLGSATLQVSGNWTKNSGTINPGTSTVVFDGTNQTITGSSPFNNFTKSVAAADTLTFAAGSIQTINGAATLNGASGQLLNLRSSSSPTRWNFTLASTATKSISYVDVQDSDASGSAVALLPVAPTNSLNSGNNASWFALSAATVSGTVYSDEGATRVGAGHTVRLLVGGVDGGSTATDVNGDYTINTSLTAGSAMLVYLDGTFISGTTATVSDGSSLAGLDIYASRLITRHDNGGILTTTELTAALGGYVDADIGYSISSGNLVVAAGTELYVPTGYSFAPGSDVTAPYGMMSRGTFNGGSGTLTLGYLTVNGGTFTSTSGTLNISENLTLLVASTFNHNGGTIVLNSSSANQTVALISNALNHLVINNTAAAGSNTVSLSNLGNGVTAVGDLTITSGVFDLNSKSMAVTGTFTNNATLRLVGSESVSFGAHTFAPASLVVYYGTTGPYTVKDWDYQNLEFNGTGGVFRLGAAESIAAGLTITAGTFDSNGFSLSVATAFTNYDTFRLQGSEAISVGATAFVSGSVVEYYGSTGPYAIQNWVYQNLVFNGTGTWQQAAALDVNGNLTIAQGTLNSSTFNLNLAGNFSNSGAYAAGTGTLTLDGNTAQSVTSGGASYNQLTITNSSAVVTLADAFNTANLTAVTPGTQLTFVGGAVFTVSGTLNFNGQATGTRIQLRSTNTTQFTLNVPGGQQTARFVDVQYSAASGNDIVAQSSLDSGNNDNGSGSPQWVFSTTVTVNSTADSGAGSLRDALLNQVAGESIVFDPTTFPPGAPVTLTLAGGDLPALSAGSVTLDASNAGVVINGTGTTGACLTISSANNVVKGLTIQNCAGDGILLASGAGNTIGGNRTVGAGPNGEGNTIISNGSDGIQIDAASAGNFLYGNYIGTDGTADLGNTANGLNIASSTNTVGDVVAGLRNVISGNNSRGVLVSGGNGNLFRNNYIGVNATATAIIANTSHGIDISGTSNPTIIGWMNAGAGNVISGNGGSGVYVHNSSAVVNIFGNFVGTNSTGDALPNTAMGLRLESATVYLGNATEVQPNVIGPNGSYGIYQFFVTSQVNLAGTIDVNDDVYFGSGTLSLGAATLQVAGNVDYSFATIYPGTSTVVLDGAAAQQVSMDTQNNLACEHVSPPTSTCFNNLTVTNNSAPVTFTSGALDSSLTATNFTATTPGTQLVFRGGSSNTITGTLNLNGQAAGTRITLDSTDATQYTFNVTGGPQRAYYVNVQDAVAATNNIIAAASVDSGNNGTGSPQWVFSNDVWVTTTADAGAGSLRQALTDAVNGNFIYFDSVVFPAAGPASTIALATALPGVTQGGLTIDASNAGVIVNGGALPAATDCLVLNSSGNTVKGLRVQNCTNDAIHISSGSGNTIGGSTLAGSGPSGEGNVLVTNGGDGIHIDSNGNFVYGNYIGTDSAGGVALGNGIRGVFINVGAQSNTIGGSAAGQRNVISGNPIGVGISGATTQLNVITSNYIGVDVAGSAGLGNSTYGVYLYNGAHDNTVGGTTAAAGNVISGNGSGVLIDGANSNTVAGNAIGTNAARNGALPNTQQGIRFINGATGNTVGSLVAGAGNVIGGNTQDGIAHDSTGTNTLLGNFVGNNGAGQAIANGGNGVAVNQGTVNLGNASEAQPHIIGPNTGYGIDTAVGATVNFAGTVDINGDVRNTASTVSFGSATINLSGSWANNGATHNVGTSLLVLDGTAAQSVSAGLQDFYDVTVTNASAVVSLSAINAVHNLTATQPGSQLTFAGGSTLTIGGTLDLNGQGTATRIQLRSTNTSQYTLNVTAGAQTVRYVDVQYSAASGNDINALNSLDSGNNDNGTGTPQWIFGTARVATTTADSGAGSLRDELTNAVSGDTISFDPAVFPPGAPVPITLGSALPDLTQGNITIDASDAGVVIDGGGVAVDCLTISSDNNVVRGLRIQNCTGNGITINSGINNSIGGDRTVGAGPNGQGNTIVSNGSNGIEILGSQTFVYGNYIGTDGNVVLANGTTGLFLFNSSNNVIGAATAGQRNVISGNTSRGIRIQNGNSNTIRNNYIGTNAAGTAALANLRGIMLEQGSSNNIIGGSNAGEGNLVSGNATYGITLTNNGTGGNSVLGNTVGTNALRTAALANGFDGITIESGAIGNTIGGTASGAGNVVAGNAQSGILHSTANSNTILGNFVGNNGAGSSIPNGGDGITISAGSVTLGNVAEVQANVIGPNTGDGIRLSGGALTLAGSPVVNDSIQLDVATTLTLGSSTLTVFGNWTNNGATVSPGTSTVVMNGSSQLLSGDSAFYNFTKAVSSNDTLTFANGSTQAISGTLTLTGTATGTLTLRSVTPGTPWNITLNPGALHSVQVVDVQDSNAGGGLAITAYGSTDSGNNVNWVFPAAAVATSLLAEVAPNVVGYGAANSPLTFDLLPTLLSGDVGFDRIDVTLPSGWSNATATVISVGGTTWPISCPTPGAGTWCANTTGTTLTVTLGSAITTTTDVRIGVVANAPAAAGNGVAAVSVINSSMIYPAVVATAGNADGDATDANALDVLIQARALTSALAEISPVEVTAARNATYTLDVRPTFGASDTGVDAMSITLPSGYANVVVTAVSANSGALTANCPSPGAGQYCAAVAAQTMTVQFGDRHTTDQIPLQVVFTADAPGQAGAATLTVALDDSATLSAMQTASAGDADADSADANTLTVNVVNAVQSDQSDVNVTPQIVLADGVSSATITITLRDVDRVPMPNKTVLLSTDRNTVSGVSLAAIVDTITQPAAVTDSNGVTGGSIVSTVPGAATVTATETGDNIAVAQRPVVYFTQGRVLELDKTASKVEAMVGDVVAYAVELRNTGAQDVVQIQVIDRLPPNFKYVEGSARVNGNAINVTGDTRTRVFDVGSIAALADTNGNGRADAGEAGYSRLTYQLVVGAGAQPGNYTNTAVARDVCDLCLISNEDDASVAVTLDPLLDLGTIVGKVFEDHNGDGRQDEGEPGIAGATVALDDGTYAVTDAHGRYHFPAVRPGQRAVKVNLQAVSDYAQNTSDAVQVVALTPGLLAKANFGVKFAPDTMHIGQLAEFGVQIESASTPEPLQVQGDVNNLAVLLNGQRVGLPEGDATMNINLLDGVTIEGDRLAQPIEFALAARQPPQVKRWTLLITDRDGVPLRRFTDEGAPPPQLAWDGRDDKGELLRGGKVYMYWLELEYENGATATSARRNFGVNKQTAVNLNLTGGAFVTGSAELTADAKKILKDAARTLREYPNETIFVDGHTDSTGSTEINERLSTDRAQAARDYLVKVENIPSKRFVVRGYGAKRPLADNDTEEGRELNRRIEIHGEVSTVDRARLLDQYRVAPDVRINGQTMPIDANGRFKANLDDAQVLQVEAVDRQGRSARGRLAIPPLEKLEPTGRMILPYGTNTTQHRVPELGVVADEIVAYHIVQAHTSPGNRVTFDGQESIADANGMFRLRVPLQRGTNLFGIMVRTTEDAVRIAQLRVDVATHTEDGRPVVAVQPIPNLTVQLPRERQQLRSSEIAINGVTDAGNHVTINGEKVDVQPDGRFTAQVRLPKGRSTIVVVAEDRDGNLGRIEREVEVTDEQLFLIAIADAKFGELRGSGRLEAAGLDRQHEYYQEGRVAYYLKGRVAGKYLVRSAYDSGETGFDHMFRNLDEGQEQRLLANLDPDKLYPVYGDDSTLVHDAQSLGKFYLAVDSDEMSALIGNFPLDLSDSELAAYRRTFYGARIAWQSLARTPYGAPTTTALVFGAEVREIHVRDELRATGGALYYLSRRDIIEGSEQIAVVVRDKDSGLPLTRSVQAVNTDYTINYAQGRILFSRPLSSVSGDGALIDQNVLGGNPVYIEVDYEARADAFEKTAQGARVRQQLGDHVAVGATAVSDELAAGRYELGGVDAELRLAQRTRVIVEAAGSSGGATPLNQSTDGGLNYTPTTPQAGREGQAWKAAADVDVNEFVALPVDVQAGAYVKKTEDGFQSAGHDANNAGTHTGVHVVAGASTADKITLRHEQADLSQAAETASLSMAQWQHSMDRWQVTTEVQARTGANAGSSDDATLGAAQIKYRHSDTITSRIEHQHTLDGARNNQSTVGAELRVTEQLDVNGSVTSATDGDSAQATASWRIGSGRAYVSERALDSRAGASTVTVVGGESAMGQRSRVYSEYQWERQPESERGVSVVGTQSQWELAQGWLLDGSAEHGAVDASLHDTQRYALSLGLSYRSARGWRAFTREEYRKEWGTTDTRQWLTVNGVEVKLNPDYTLLGKLRRSRTVNDNTQRTTAGFDERSIGLAYRPVASDIFNALTRYTVLDERPPQAGSDDAPVDERSEIISAEWSWDFSRWAEWVDKQAFKTKRYSAMGVPDTTTHTWLSIHRINVHLHASVDGGVEFRTLTQREAGDRRSGWLLELAWKIAKHVRIGAGYNFTDFSDNEFSDNDYSVRGRFVRVQAVY